MSQHFNSTENSLSSLTCLVPGPEASIAERRKLTQAEEKDPQQVCALTSQTLPAETHY